MQNVWIWIVAVVVIAGGGFWWWQSTQMPATNTGADNGIVDTGTTPQPEAPSVPMAATITYNGSSFSPSEVTIKKGGTVTFTNTGSSNMWVASGPHPEHTGYSGTSRSAHCPDTSNAAFDQCAAGNSFIFMFQKVGTWGYHNHLNASSFGKVIVVE